MSYKFMRHIFNNAEFCILLIVYIVLAVESYIMIKFDGLKFLPINSALEYWLNLSRTSHLVYYL